MRIFGFIFLTVFSASLAFAQEKKIKKAIQALDENNYEESCKYINEYMSESSAVPLATFVEYLIFTKQGSPKYDIEQGFKKIQTVNQWMNTNTPDKGWCKSYGLCLENLPAQIDSLAFLALRKVESNKSEQAYQHFIQTFTNTPINASGIESYQHWKFEVAASENTLSSLEAFIKQFPNSQDVEKAKENIERIEYSKGMASGEITQIEAFLKKYPNSIYKSELQLKLLELEFKLCAARNDKSCLYDLLKKHPNSSYTNEIKIKIEEIDYTNVKKSGGKEIIEAFIRDYPNSIYKSELQLKLLELEYKQCAARNDKSCLYDFLKKHPNSSYTNEIKIKIEEMDYTDVKKSGSKEILEAFIRDNPNSKYIDEAKKKLDELVNGVVITCSGQGKTSDEAKQNALRSAIEQTFGTFISSKTEVLNDELVSDQITSLSSGNIRSYEIIDEVELPTGGFSTTLKAIISIEKLTSFVQSKGVQVEFKGGLFALNIKQQLLNETAEINIVNNVVGILHNVLQESFDYSLDVSEPKSINGASDFWEVPILIKVLPNANMEWCYNYVRSNLLSIGLAYDERTNYEKLNKPFYQLIIKYDNSLDTIFFRTKLAFESFERFNNLWFYTHSFYITNGLKTIRNVGNVTSENYNNFKLRPKFSPLHTNNTLEFLNPNLMKPQLIYNYSDQLKLADIEKITNYDIKQDSIRNKFENGGYSFRTNDGTEFTMSSMSSLIPIDKVVYFEDSRSFITLTFLDSLIASYNNSNYMGYNDWRLPTVEELEVIFENVKLNNFDNLLMKYFSGSDDDIQLISSSYKLENGYYDEVSTREQKVFYVSGPSGNLFNRFENLINSLNFNYEPLDNSTYVYTDYTNGYSQKIWYGRNFLRANSDIPEVLLLMVR